MGGGRFLKASSNPTGDGDVHSATTGSQVGTPGGMAKPIAAAALMTPTAACAQGAPSLVFFGAYFPVWLACAVIGVATAGVARMLMVLSGLSQRLPHQLLLCAAIGGVTGILVGLLWFGL